MMALTMSFGEQVATSVAQPENNTFLSFEESLLQSTTERIGLCGLPGAGKSHALLTIFEAIRDVYKIPPEKATVYILDCDNGGMAKLVRRGLVPAEYRQCIKYVMPHSWQTITEATAEILDQVPALSAANGPGSTWLLVDNVYKTYRWARDQYCQDVFGMSELDRAKAQRRKALSNPNNKRGVLPTFDQQIDYGTITPMYLTSFWDPIMFSGTNLVVTFPTYEKWETDANGKRRPKEIAYRCQSQVEHDLDDIVWYRNHPEDPSAHLASMRKSRTLPKEKMFTSIPDMTLPRILTIFKELREASE